MSVLFTLSCISVVGMQVVLYIIPTHIHCGHRFPHTSIHNGA